LRSIKCAHSLFWTDEVFLYRRPNEFDSRQATVPRLTSNWTCELGSTSDIARDRAAQVLRRRYGQPEVGKAFNNQGNLYWSTSAGAWALGGSGLSWTSPPDWEAYPMAEAGAAWRDVGRALINSPTGNP
jgi:hypothetical protein